MVQYKVITVAQALDQLQRILDILLKKTTKTYRFVPQWSYNIVYRIEDDPPVVNAVTIAHASQSSKEIEKYLK